jgi:hypothetical protein
MKTEPKQESLGAVDHETETESRSDREAHEISPPHDRGLMRQVPVATRRSHFDKPEPFIESGFEEAPRRTSGAIREPRSEASSIIEGKIIAAPAFTDSPFIARREDREGDGDRMVGPLHSAVEPATRQAGAKSEPETAPAKPAPEVPKKIVAEPRVSLYVEPRRADLTAQPPSAPEAPVINVTIGRVEVRANVRSAPSPKPRPTPKTMSLDEYLRQRANGGNR